MKHFHFREVTSTNDYADELLEKEDRVIVTADYQSAGRGRNNHSWFGSFGDNLYFSYGLRHKEPMPIEELIKYQLVGCIAAQNVLMKLCPIAVFRLKYPNDVYAYDNDKYFKIAGILIEHTFSGQHCSKSIVGIGINVMQSSFGGFAGNNPISLKNMGYDFKPDDLIEPLIKEIEILLPKPADRIFDEWSSRLNIIGKEIEVIGIPGKWYARELLSDSRLMLASLDRLDEKIIDNADSIRYEID